jgi:hypothetical protein
MGSNDVSKEKFGLKFMSRIKHDSSFIGKNRVIENSIKLKHITKINKKKRDVGKRTKKHLATKRKEYEKYKVFQHMNPIPSDTLFSGNVLAVSSGIKFETT